MNENPVKQPFKIILDNRLHTVWEKCEALALRIYNINTGWFEGRPTIAPQIMHKIAEEFLEIPRELDAIARDIAAEDVRVLQERTAASKYLTEKLGQFERDALTKRLGEIVRTPHEPPEPTS